MSELTKKEESTTFDSFKSHFEKQNKKLKLYFSVTALVQTIAFLLLLVHKNIYFIKNVPFVQNELKVAEVCLLGMKQIINNRHYPAYMDKGLIQGLEKNNIHFKFQGELEYFKPQMLKDNLCHFTFKDKRGIAGFLVKMQSKSHYPFGHKIYDFDEIHENQEVLK